MPACVGMAWYKTLGPSSLFDNSETNDIRRSPNSDCALDTVLGVDRSPGDKACCVVVTTDRLLPGSSALCPEYAGYAGGAMPSFPSVIITVSVPGTLS